MLPREKLSTFVFFIMLSMSLSRVLVHSLLSFVVSSHFIGFNPRKTDWTVMRKTTSVGFIVLAIYADDIFLIDNDEVDLSTSKACLQAHFVMRDLNTLLFPLN